MTFLLTPGPCRVMFTRSTSARAWGTVRPVRGLATTKTAVPAIIVAPIAAALETRFVSFVTVNSPLQLLAAAVDIAPDLMIWIDEPPLPLKR